MGRQYDKAEYKRNRKIILESSNYICHYCNSPDAVTADHIRPISSFDDDNDPAINALDNLVAACHNCNSTRQDRTMYRLRYWNKRYQ